jgi:CMP-N-acetylneuraminic acid synthetase
MKTIAIITARSGSSGIRNKNIKILKNKPLIYHTVKFAKKLKFLDKIIFSTDSKKYLKIAQKYYPFNNSLRPKRLATKYTKSIDVIKYLINLEKKIGNFYDAVLILEPTSPFRKLNDFKKAYQKLKKTKIDSILTIKKVKHDPNQMIVGGKNIFKPLNNKIIFQPRQKNQNKFVPAGSMYFSKINNINKNKIVGKKFIGIPVKGKYATNIDDEEDFFLAKNFFK